MFDIVWHQNMELRNSTSLFFIDILLIWASKIQMSPDEEWLRMSEHDGECDDVWCPKSHSNIDGIMFTKGKWYHPPRGALFFQANPNFETDTLW